MVQETGHGGQEPGAWPPRADKQLVTQADRPGPPGQNDAVQPMEVFLVPAGPSYELYCEPADDDSAPSGRTGRMFQRVRELLSAEPRAAESRHSNPGDVTRTPSWTDRARAGAVRRLTEWVAEQRLLWALRHQHAATLVFPDDLDGERALALLHDMLQRDREHHRVWLIVDGVATAVFGPLLFFVPGPNLVSWYFAAETAGHWLAFQGASRGDDRVQWSGRPSRALAAVREAHTLPSAARQHRFGELAAELQLAHLAVFLQRTVR